MRKPNPSDIKHSGVLGEHYFSRESMRFFGQTMKDFKTVWHNKGKGIVKLFARGSMFLKNPVARHYRQNCYFSVKGVSERYIDVSGKEWKEVKIN